jgi:hypothetical protein
MKSLRLFLCASAFLLSVLPAGAASRHASLDAWIANELTPFVREQLTTHPRFKGESLRFVVLENGNPQAASNSLALGVRDRLRDSVADVAGIRIAWQPDNPHYLRHTGPGGIDCTKTEVHYLIGIEMKLLDPGTLSVEIRALDMEDRSIVTGFSKSWQGQISSRQYREFRRAETDLTFRGEREVPYDESQSDLLAAHLAHDLGCGLLRQTEAEYVIAQAGDHAEDDPVNSMVELVGNNLARYSSLQISSAAETANSIIEGKAHRIDEDLYQYWITVQPREAGSELSALSASAYVRLPEKFVVAEIFDGPADPALRSKPGFLGSLRLVELQESTSCLAPGISDTSQRYQRSYADNGECFALAVRSSDDAVVFFLHHQLNNGLVRLADASCFHSTSARIVKSKQQVQFVLPAESLTSAAWNAAESWQLYPDRDTFYAVAATDNKAARELSGHIRRLPRRCSASVRPGLEGIGLRQWTDELTRIIDRWGPAIHWQTIRVKNIY